MCSDEIIPIDYSKCHDFPDLSHVMAEYLRGMNGIHEQLLREVLKQILNREVVLEDAKDLTMIRYPEDIMDYDLAYKGVKIGRVIFTFDGPKSAVTFRPVKEFSKD